MASKSFLYANMRKAGEEASGLLFAVLFWKWRLAPNGMWKLHQCSSAVSKRTRAYFVQRMGCVAGKVVVGMALYGALIFHMQYTAYQSEGSA